MTPSARPRRRTAHLDRLLAVKGRRSIRDFHRETGRILWDNVGMSRTDSGLRQAVADDPHLA